MTEAAARAGTSWRRRHGSTLLVVAALLLAVLVTVALNLGNDTQTAPYDPGNAGPGGARALARVLDHEGVDVSVVRSAAELEETRVDEAGVVVVTSTDQLGQDTVERLLKQTRKSRLVLVDPGREVVETVSATAGATPITLGHELKAGCDDPRFDGLTLDVDSAFVYTGGVGCFEKKLGSVVQQLGGVTLFGGGEAMTNDQILHGDNAAVSLRLLGQGENLIWYIPQLRDVGADDALGVGAMLPRWIGPGLWMVAIAAVFLITWRARRLGPLSTEPLPVVIKAIETTRSRGRLYRKAQDRSHAAAALRTAARARAAIRLGLGPGHDHEALVRDLARHVSRPESEVRLLVGAESAPPRSDRDLIALARMLSELDREARRT